MLFIPNKMGSYSQEDVQFLLRDLSHISLEKTVEERESSIQSGKMHYSEMLPVEYQPNEEYMTLFKHILEQNAKEVAEFVAIVAEKIVAYRGLEHLVLVSLARAGTPIGILIKRYILKYYNVNVPHYSISIIRDRGIDETALQYIIKQHPEATVQFVDGWTGKGAITKELDIAITKWNLNNRHKLDAYLAVIADPGKCAHLSGTQKDFLIPSACLNSTVSGLVSRTVMNEKYMEKGDFHGAKYYRELKGFDVSNAYIDTIVQYFNEDLKYSAMNSLNNESILTIPSWEGLKQIETIQSLYEIQNINHIKPGIGETTRVLLRRVPWKILINPNVEQNLKHIYLLAEQLGVEIEEYADMPYSSCGLIKELL